MQTLPLIFKFLEHHFNRTALTYCSESKEKFSEKILWKVYRAVFLCKHEHLHYY